MAWTMEGTVQPSLALCPTLMSAQKGSCHQEMGDQGGAWAALYLMKRHGTDIWMKYYEALGAASSWEQAFAETFNQSPDEFYAEFETSLRQPLSQQLANLP